MKVVFFLILDRGGAILSAFEQDPSGHFAEGGLPVCLGGYLSAEREESVDGEMHKGKITHTYCLTELFLA